MEPTQALIDELYRDKVLRARAMDPSAKLSAGFRLFQRSRSLMLAGIRDEFPQADEEEVHRILRRRLRIARILENTPL